MVVGIFFSFLQQMCVFIYFLVSGIKEPNPAELWTCLHAVISASSQSSFHSSSGFGSFLCVMSVYLNWYWWMGCCCCPNVSLSPKPKLFFCKFLYHSLPNKYSAFLLMIIKLHLVSPVSGCQLQDVTSLHCCLHLLSKKNLHMLLTEGWRRVPGNLFPLSLIWWRCSKQQKCSRHSAEDLPMTCSDLWPEPSQCSCSSVNSRNAQELNFLHVKCTVYIILSFFCKCVLGLLIKVLV